jgi:hypothetical protein
VDERSSRPKAVKPEPAPPPREPGWWLQPFRNLMRRRWLTPVQGVLLCVVAVVAGTAWWMLHARAVQQAQIVLAASSKQGQELVQQGDYSAAAAELRRAVDALETLGRDDPPARATRQLWREAEAASHLALKSPHELLEEAAAPRPAAELNWTQTFRASYRDAWLLFETSVTRTDEPAPAARYRLEFPIVAGQARAVVVADLKAFDALPVDVPSQRVIFAAQLDDLRPDPAAANTWLIVLRPDTAFLWANAATWQAQGAAVDPQTAETLVKQSQLLGISP